MSVDRALAIAAAVSFAAYVTGFAFSDVPNGSSLVLAAAGVACAAGSMTTPLFVALRRPLWSWVPLAFAVFVAIPWYGTTLLYDTGLAAHQGDCDPCVDSSILAVFALPAALFAAIGVLLAPRLRRR